MGEELKLLGAWGSPFSRRVEIALKIKGVEYEYLEEDILHNKSALLLEYNPVHKKVPVLVHNGKPIAESQVILEYIDETWQDNPMLPRDPHERAMARFWAKFLDEKCLPALWKYCWSFGEEQEKAYEEAFGVLKSLEGELKDKKFFGGNNLGFVDIAANFVGFWIGVVQEAGGLEILTPDRFPRLCRWAEEFRSCLVVKENLPPRDRLYALFKARFEKISGSKDAELASRH
ncbi:glutathione S-transferase U8-like [Syzygium oleosum]|uniref:glutathione S-transferase U8-like n=1 Tax=Syzygium oleosum TaxID=219896 RepID=UPI0011D1E760|nr:glutathione S-transferase U8-like [Syzygium oleosum]